MCRNFNLDICFLNHLQTNLGPYLSNQSILCNILSVNIYQNYRRVLDVMCAISVLVLRTQTPDSGGDNLVKNPAYSVMKSGLNVFHWSVSTVGPMRLPAIARPTPLPRTLELLIPVNIVVVFHGLQQKRKFC